MSPSRRQFLVGTLAVGAAGSLLGFVAFEDAASAHAAAPLSRPAASLPPSKRLVDLACSECGSSLGLVLLDEFDKPEPAVCDECYQEQVVLADEADSDRYADEDTADELDALRETHQTLEDTHNMLVDTLEDLTWQLRDIEGGLRQAQAHANTPGTLSVVVAPWALARQVERTREQVEHALSLSR